MMELSLVICTYKRPREVRRLLESITEQTRIPDEILIIDGSDDFETKEAIEKLEGSLKKLPISYFLVDTQNRGLTRQRNFGIERASGQIISFVDDDTVLTEDYFEQLIRAFQRNPAASGVGGYIDEPGVWRKSSPDVLESVRKFYWNGWERKEGIRFVIRKILGLDSPDAGRTPEWGHGRSNGFLPPDGNDHEVDCLIGCSCAFRKSVFDQERFSKYFEGYGLYEDFEFSIRAAKYGPLILSTRVRLAHYHSPSGRPNHFKYGVMVVRNGWLVWRKQYPTPSLKAKLKWWSITLLLTGLRLVDFRSGNAKSGFPESFGRIWGVITLLLSAPK